MSAQTWLSTGYERDPLKLFGSVQDELDAVTDAIEHLNARVNDVFSGLFGVPLNVSVGAAQVSVMTQAQTFEQYSSAQFGDNLLVSAVVISCSGKPVVGCVDHLARPGGKVLDAKHDCLAHNSRLKVPQRRSLAAGVGSDCDVPGLATSSSGSS